MHRAPIVLAAAAAVAATVVTAAALIGPALTADEPPSDAGATQPVGTRAPTSTPSATPTRFPFRSAGDHDWLTAVPADLSVSAGLPDDGGDFDRVSEAVTWTFCDTEAFPEDDVLDVRRDGATGPEYADRRDLRVFPDDRAAHAYLVRAAAVARNCPEETHGVTRWLHSVAPVDGVGEESMRILETYETDGMVNAGATWWDVIRVGNAVLVSATGGEYLPGETLGQGVREHDRLLAPIVGSMCVFSAEGCTSDDPLVLEHDGIGPLRLGMTAEEATAAGARVSRAGSGCQQLTMTLGEHRITGDIDPDLGVSMLWGSGAETQEGIGGFSSLREVRTAYPDLTGDQAVVTARASDTAYYRLELYEGFVDSVRLVLDRQGCAS